MSGTSERCKNWGVPERIAAWAGVAGFSLSAVFLSLYLAVGRTASGGHELRASLETLFVFFWPSVILMVGAHSTQGGIILFLLSASLNAGYYVFLALAAYALYSKLQMPPASSASIRTYRAPRIAERIAATRPLV